MSYFIKNNILTISILLFLFFFCIINYLKPSVMYNEYGEIRPFGLGYSHKTVIPIWLFSIVLAILCYLGVFVAAHTNATTTTTTTMRGGSGISAPTQYHIAPL
jgi:hypothetical protein